MYISKGSKILINSKTIVFNENVYVDEKKRYAFIILDMWNQCDIADISVLPAKYVELSSEQEEYELRKYNVILGRAIDVCLN